MAPASRPPGGRPPGKKFFWSSPWSPFTWSCGPHAPSRVSSSASVLLVWTQSDEVCARHRQRSSKSATSTPGRALRNNVRIASHLPTPLAQPLVPAERANARASTRRTMAATLAATTIPDDTRPTRSHPIDRDRSPPIVCRKLRSKCCFVEAVDRVLACGSELIRRRESPSRSIDRSRWSVTWVCWRTTRSTF